MTEKGAGMAEVEVRVAEVGVTEVGGRGVVEGGG